MFSLGDEQWAKEGTPVTVTQMRTEGENYKMSWSGFLDKTH